MSSFVIGLLIFFGFLYGSLVHLGQDVSYYYDFVAIAMVFGGTIAVFVISFSKQNYRDFKELFVKLLGWTGPDLSIVHGDCQKFIQNHKQGIPYKSSLNNLSGEVLRDGNELYSFGLSKEKVQIILEERIYEKINALKDASNKIRSLAKYPPAFGLAGTVLGLVNLMRHLSSAADASETGAQMAIALVATFYGLLVANAVVNPVGEKMFEIARDEEKKAQLALQSVYLGKDHESTLLECQEFLSAYEGKKSPGKSNTHLKEGMAA
jgi:chemotaxis protein MotA